MDPNGYPDEEELLKIEKWPYTDLLSLMAYVKERWRYSDTPYWHEEGTTFQISTGGWSGNESLINALEANTMFWILCWESSRRGGHYVFIIPDSCIFKAKKKTKGIGKRKAAGVKCPKK